MYKVLLAGGLASGKSTVSDLLRGLGAEVESLDRISVEVRNSPDVAAALAEAFGPQVLDDEGMTIPSEIAVRAFASSESVETMNSICLPKINARAAEYLLAGEGDAPMRVLEVPLLDKAPELLELADEVVVVEAPIYVRIERAVSRGLSEEDARNRIGSQAGQPELERMADTVIANDSTPEELERKVRAWWDSRVSR